MEPLRAGSAVGTIVAPFTTATPLAFKTFVNATASSSASALHVKNAVAAASITAEVLVRRAGVVVGRTQLVHQAQTLIDAVVAGELHSVHVGVISSAAEKQLSQPDLYVIDAATDTYAVTHVGDWPTYIVTIRASGLRDMDSDSWFASNDNDVYIVVKQLRNGAVIQTRQSSVHEEAGTDPTLMHFLAFTNTRMGDTFELELFDADDIGADDRIGKAILTASSHDTSSTLVYSEQYEGWMYTNPTQLALDTQGTLYLHQVYYAPVMHIIMMY